MQSTVIKSIGNMKMNFFKNTLTTLQQSFIVRLVVEWRRVSKYEEAFFFQIIKSVTYS